MTHALLALAVLAAALAPPLAPALARDADPLARHRWKARLVVVSAPDPADARVAAQRRIFAAATAGMRERDLLLVEALGEGAEAGAIRRGLGLPADAFRAVLVGKDGGAKRVEAAPLTSETLFAEIDAMPMRRQESRRP